jgi:uncharacterized protein YcfL
MKYLLLLLLFLSLFLLFLTGCTAIPKLTNIAQETSLTETHLDTVKRIDQLEDNIGNQNLAVIQNDVLQLKSVITDNKVKSEIAISRASDLHKEAKAREMALNEWTKIVLTTTDLALGGRVGQVIDKTRLGLEIVTANKRRQLEEKMSNKLAKSEKDTMYAIDNIRNKLSNLEMHTQQKLAQVTQEQLRDITELKSRSEIVEKLQSELGLTQAELKQLDGLSIQEIIAIIAAASGIGIGGSRLVSRSGKQIEKLKSEVDTIKSNGNGHRHA